jgi:small subunit ribosomal protein S19
MKPPFIASKLLSSINDTSVNKVILTWSRSSTIVPVMIGHTLAVHNGIQHIPIYIQDQMVGHKLGEFVRTRKFQPHVSTDKKAKRR